MLQESAATQSERNWAMLAHLTALLTVLVGLHSGGVGSVVALLVPLGMYLYFRERSPYVAFHALQAITFVASLFVFPAMFLLARSLRASAPVAIGAGLLLAFFPNVWFFGGTAFSDVPSLVLVLVAPAPLPLEVGRS